MNTSELPSVLQLPATAGSSVGCGELGAGGAERVTRSGAAPSAIAGGGMATRRVAGSGACCAAPAEASRPPILWPRVAATTTAIATTTATIATGRVFMLTG